MHHYSRQSRSTGGREALVLLSPHVFLPLPTSRNHHSCHLCRHPRISPWPTIKHPHVTCILGTYLTDALSSSRGRGVLLYKFPTASHILLSLYRLCTTMIFILAILAATRASPLVIPSPPLFSETNFKHPPVTIPDKQVALEHHTQLFLTIFLCTWASVHPNIPSPDERWPSIVFRRIRLMVALLSCQKQSLCGHYDNGWLPVDLRRNIKASPKTEGENQ
jgi:hypothetical protein